MKNKLSLLALAVISTLSVFGWTETYHYDANGRLSQVSGSLNESYKYDSRGNIQEIQKEGETVRFEYDRVNQLKQRTDNEGIHTFVYDKAGRLTEENLNEQLLVRYTYGYLDKVTSVERNGQLTKFRYNGDGMLVEKEYPDGTLEKWSWDRLALIARGDERYINEPHASGGVPIMSLTAKGVRYHTSDYLGTTLWSTDEKGRMTDCYAATPYGQGKALEDDPAARFTGKPYDKDLGAFVFPFRNYDSKNVRWRSADLKGFPDGINNHIYVYNPLNQIDPLGADICHYNDSSGGLGFGHSAWIVGNISSGYTVYDYGNTSSSSGSSGSSNGTDLMGTHYDSFADAEAAIDQNRRGNTTTKDTPNGNTYDRIQLTETTAAQDAAFIAAANGYDNDPYGAFSHNCYTLGRDGANAAGVEISQDWAPNDAFDENGNMTGRRWDTVNRNAPVEK